MAQPRKILPVLIKSTTMTEGKNDLLKGYTMIFDSLSEKAMHNLRAISPTSLEDTFCFTDDELRKHLYGKKNVQMIDIERILRKRKLLDSETTTNKRSRVLSIECLSDDELNNIEMTYSIMSFPNDVQLCLSGIPGYKLGVCSKENMPGGTWIGPYEGKRITKTKFKETEDTADTSYCWEIYKDGKLDHFLDGSDRNASSWMRYIRCARNYHEQNMHMVQYGPNIYYCSFKDIKRGDELLVWYENQYEQHFGIPLRIKLSSFGMPTNGRSRNPGVQKTQLKITVPRENGNSIQKPSPSYLNKTNGLTLPGKFPPEVNQSFTSSIHYVDYHRQEPSANSSPPLSASPVASPTDDHMSSTELLEDKEIGLWKCGQCRQRFTQRSALRLHVCPCQADNPYHCGHCSVSFADPTKLRAHVVTHNNERPFKCGFCSRTFAGPTTLNNHVRTHTGQKPFTCEKCGKSFSQASQMSRHQRIAEDCN